LDDIFNEVPEGIDKEEIEKDGIINEELLYATSKHDKKSLVRFFL